LCSHVGYQLNLITFFLPGLDYCSRWICCFLLQWRVFVSIERAHECFKSCHCSNACSFNESVSCSQALLRTDQTVINLGTLFRWQFQCHFKEISQYGREILRLPLNILILLPFPITSLPFSTSLFHTCFTLKNDIVNICAINNFKR
jgi:hypothetical protein